MDNQDKDNEDYKFIQETIVSKKRKKVKKIVAACLGTILLAILFGLVARLTFCLSEPLFNRFFQMGNDHKGDNIFLGDSNGEEDNPQEENNSGEVVDGDNSEIDPEKEQPKGDGDNNEKEEETKKTEEENSPQPPTIIEKKVKADLKDFLNMYRQLGDLARQANQSITMVTCIKDGVDYFQNPYEMEETTSGLILAVDETWVYILTSLKRTKEANALFVTFENGIKTNANCLSVDEEAGLAILTVLLKDIPDIKAEDIPVAPLGESYSLSVGDPVLALGNPNGYMYSMLIGCVTNSVNYAYVTDNRLELFNTDMRIDEKGEGILLNMEGKVVGIITQTLGENKELCTVLSISKLKPLLEKLINQTPIAFLGVIATDVPEEITEKIKQSGGVYVNEVSENSPAAEAGLRPGDVILSLNGTNISSLTAFCGSIQSAQPKEIFSLLVYRMNREKPEKIKISIELGQKN